MTLSGDIRTDFLTDRSTRWTSGCGPIDGLDLTSMCDILARAILSAKPPVATLTALAALDVTDEPDGSARYVNDVEDWYILEKATSHTADGLCVVSAYGGGYWVSRIVGRWDDLQGTIREGDATALLTWQAFRDSPVTLGHFRRDQTDSLGYVWQLPHKWKIGTSVVPHIHCVPMGDPTVTEYAYFTMSYYWAVTGGAIPAVSGWATMTPIAFPIYPGDANKLKICSFGSVSPNTGALGSSCLLFHVSRVGGNVLDTYNTSNPYGAASANLALISSDLHYKAGTFGTESELI